MQAVILAAGEGKRLLPLTLEKPKPLVHVIGLPILEHIIDAFPAEVDEVILVIGYKADMIRCHFGSMYKDRRIKYVEQIVPTGTAHALALAKPLLDSGRFLFTYGDDLHGAVDIERALQFPLSILAATHQEPSKFGVIEMNEDGTLSNIIEKPLVPPTNLISTGVMVLDEHIFDYEPVQHENGEFYLTSLLMQLAREYPVMVVKQDFWVPIGYPEDIVTAERILKERGQCIQE